jgi:hypothetical protein
MVTIWTKTEFGSTKSVGVSSIYATVCLMTSFFAIV